MFTKKCPKCNLEINYSTKYTYNKSLKSNSICKKCSSTAAMARINNEVTLGIRDNGFKGHKHSAEFIKKMKSLDKSYTKTDEFRSTMRKVSGGKNNPMYGRSFYDIWLEKYGKDIADQKLVEMKLKLSKASSGKNNPMYGKPSPKGSGNGWKGWYKGIFFRSLLELSFLINYVDRFKMKMENGEKAKYAIKYKDYLGTDRTYFPDYIINDKYMVEVKPKKLINSPLVKAKSKAAIKFCKKNGLQYKILSPVSVNISEYKEHIKFTEKSEIRKDDYFGSTI